MSAVFQLFDFHQFQFALHQQVPPFKLDLDVFFLKNPLSSKTLPCYFSTAGLWNCVPRLSVCPVLPCRNLTLAGDRTPNPLLLSSSPLFFPPSLPPSAIPIVINSGSPKPASILTNGATVQGCFLIGDETDIWPLIFQVIGIDLLSQSLLPAIVELAEDRHWRV
ncbi:hypothetical protein ACSBR2_004734 [Camellia fascicularis]